MSVQRVAVVRVLAILFALGLLAPLAATAQSGSVPRLPDGKPDLQGVWDFSSVTPLQAPRGTGRPGVPDGRGCGRAGSASRGQGRHRATGWQPRQLQPVLV